MLYFAIFCLFRRSLAIKKQHVSYAIVRPLAQNVVTLQHKPKGLVSRTYPKGIPNTHQYNNQNKQSRHRRHLLQKPREDINFASVIQICKLRPRQGVFFPSGGKKNLEFGMLNVELSAKPMLNYPILNWEFRIQEATTELKLKKLKIQKNSKLKNSKCA